MGTGAQQVTSQGGDAVTAGLRRLGEFLREQRRVASISQRQLAERIGLSDTYLSQLERGLHQPSISALKAIAAGLNVRAEELISFAAGLAGEQRDETAPSDARTEPPPSTTEAAIGADPRLTAAQRDALLRVLEGFLAANEAPRRP